MAQVSPGGGSRESVLHRWRLSPVYREAADLSAFGRQINSLRWLLGASWEAR
jgi:hypothetical protein